MDAEAERVPLNRPAGQNGRTRRSTQLASEDVILVDDDIEKLEMPQVTPLDELGAKVANTYLTNVQRGSGVTIQARKFFKSATPQSPPEVPNHVDVSKVLKLISPTAADQFNMYPNKTHKGAVKTYTNRRRQLNENSFETFGLPDDPIVAVKSPNLPPILNSSIDVDLNTKVNVNLNPCEFQGFYSAKKSLNSTFDDLSASSLTNLFTSTPDFKKSSRKTINLITERSTTKVKGPKKPKKKQKTPIKLETIIKKEPKEFEVGDLTWAKIGSFCYWPCMITTEPMTGMHVRLMSYRTRYMYHVRFLGDKGRRSWVYATNLIHFTSGKDMDNLANQHRAEKTMTIAKINECFVIKRSKLMKWTEGIREAESLLNKSIQERLAYFDELFLSIKQDKKRKYHERIEKRMLDQSGTSEQGLKKIKLEDDACVYDPILLLTKIKCEEDEEKLSIDQSDFPIIDLNKTSNSIETEDIDEKPPILNQIQSPVIDNTMRRKLRSSTGKESEVEASKKLINVQPLSAKKKTRTLQEVLAVQSMRKKLRSSGSGVDIKPEKPPSEEGKDVEAADGSEEIIVLGKDSFNSSDIESVSDNSSGPASLKSQAALFRRNNLFRGVPKEAVCQICEMNGDVFKCKGPCSGLYHRACAGVPDPAPVTTAQKTLNVEIISLVSRKSRPLPVLSPNHHDQNLSLSDKIDLRMREIMKISETYEESPEESDIESSPEPKAQRTRHVTADCDAGYDLVPASKSAPISDEQRCYWCSHEELPRCSVCHREETDAGSSVRLKCSFQRCGKYYHPECLKQWPQTQWLLTYTNNTENSFVCPRHVCHMCVSDDPRAANTRCKSDRIVKCLRCPAIYHTSSYCVPAGSHILSSSQIVCPRHFDDERRAKKRNSPQTINTNWCFICSKGGHLVCCETCPTSVHADCLPGNNFNKDDIFYCEDCQSGRMSLYDEIVWVKLGTFRWWPALILFPNEVPDNVRNLGHNRGEFVVKFFGTYDHYWVGRGRTFLFQEGDKGQSNPVKKRVDSAFARAIKEATAAHALKKQFKVSKVAEKNSWLKPPPYVRIKVNKPVGNVRQFDGNISNTTSCDCNPSHPSPCGPDSDCLNRLLLTECNPEMCPAGHRCNNQRFEKREYPPLLPYHTDSRGWGLKTLAPIRKGQFIIEYVGEMIDEQEYQRRIQKMHEKMDENYYFLTIDNHRMLDAGPKGNVARFMNHSCQPNCETQKWTVNGDTRVGLFASDDIAADTELTFNYNLECIGKEKKVCRCNASNCSGFIGGKVKTEEIQKSTKLRKLKKKKKLKLLASAEPEIKDGPCFICGKNGEVGCCNNKNCTKFYHLDCVGVTSWPEGGKWICPWHNCNLCSKRTIRCCYKCPNSFCPPHSEGNVRYDKLLLGFVCFEHDSNNQANVGVEMNDLAKEIPLNIATSTPVKPNKPKEIETTACVVKIEKISSNASKTTATPKAVLVPSIKKLKTQRTSRNSSKKFLNRTNPDLTSPVRRSRRLSCQTL